MNKALCAYLTANITKNVGTSRWVYPEEGCFVIQPEICFRTERLGSFDLLFFTQI